MWRCNHVPTKTKNGRRSGGHHPDRNAGGDDHHRAVCRAGRTLHSEARRHGPNHRGARPDPQLHDRAGLLQAGHGHFPTTEQGLQALRVKPGDANQWAGPYMPQEIPKDPWATTTSTSSRASTATSRISFASEPTASRRRRVECRHSQLEEPVRSRGRGVTLVEMLIVVAIVGLMVGITFPAVSAGLDSVRLASATDSLASFLNAAVNRAERHQQPMELIISPKDNLLTLYSNEPGFTRELRLPEGIAIEAVLPRNPDDPQGARRLILMPGATVPGIGIQIANSRGTRRIVRLDPMTGFPRVESVIQSDGQARIHAAGDGGGHPDHGGRGGRPAVGHFGRHAQRRPAARVRPGRATGALRMNDLLMDYLMPRDTLVSGTFDPALTGGIESGWRARLENFEMPPAPAAGPACAGPHRAGNLVGQRQRTPQLYTGCISHARLEARRRGRGGAPMRRESGTTLIEVLIAVTLLSLLSVGMLTAMRVGFMAFSKTNDKLMENRRVAGTQRVVQEQLEGMMPVVAPCGDAPELPRPRPPSSRASPRPCGWCPVSRCNRDGAASRRFWSSSSFPEKRVAASAWWSMKSRIPAPPAWPSFARAARGTR
jgi:prepilin-type N-terminal cleavage/methylation domain-containing protein